MRSDALQPWHLAAQAATNPTLALDVRLKASQEAYDLLYHHQVTLRHEGEYLVMDVATAAREWWRGHVMTVHPMRPLDGEDWSCNCDDGALRVMAQEIQRYHEWGVRNGR